MEFKDTIEQAIEQAPERNFTESVELIINLRSLDLSNPDNRIDKEVVLPHGKGKKTKIGVIASGETKTKAGGIADKVFGKEDLEKLGDNKTKAKKIADKFDHFIAEAKLMADVGKHLGQVLGPRNKMPTPLKPGGDLEEKVNRLRSTIDVKMKGDFVPTLQLPIGTEEMDTKDIKENAETSYKEILKEMPQRKQNIDSIYIKTTMGPSVEVEK